ncbi:hypothetical protein KFL_001570050 [Klebsormidium nitens]|uniref:Uncharacterized protein n=1 Tax=Klebsormidium nitens TaxID=105231 RepID=A0A0U9HRR0_KLENI|nr:hypothetical protein KFL_001570050 [Klebsormidium nitens]|eukprot:GAQ83666.1 hypothetical protein KFL_001570050 [Klebsormidium nitens]
MVGLLEQLLEEEARQRRIKQEFPNACPFIVQELARQERLFLDVTSVRLQRQKAKNLRQAFSEGGGSRCWGSALHLLLRAVPVVLAALSYSPESVYRSFTTPTKSRCANPKSNRASQTDPVGDRPAVFPVSRLAVPRGLAVFIAASSPMRLPVFASTADLTLRLNSAGIRYEPLLKMAECSPVMVFENGEIPLFQVRFPFEEPRNEFLTACAALGDEALSEQGLLIAECMLV